jgi:NitT/TauT family transport system permease protein
LLTHLRAFFAAFCRILARGIVFMFANQKNRFVQDDLLFAPHEKTRRDVPPAAPTTEVKKEKVDSTHPSSFITHTRKGIPTSSLTRYAAGLTLGALLALWQILAMLRVYPDYILPTPAQVIERFGETIASGALWRHSFTTLTEATLGFGAAALVAGLLCYPLANSKLFSALLSPLLAATQAIPLVAIAPLLVIWFGFGLTPKIITCALIVFFPLLLNAVSGLKQVDKTLKEAAAVEGANRWHTFRLIELPLALPTILTGVKIGLTVSITGAVVGEFIAADAGLGYLLNLGRGQFDTPLVFVALITLSGIALAGYGLVGLIERRLHARGWG